MTRPSRARAHVLVVRLSTEERERIERGVAAALRMYEVPGGTLTMSGFVRWAALMHAEHMVQGRIVKGKT